MSMSDCIYCDSTPCRCGKSGYLAIYPTQDNIEIYKSLSYDELELLEKKLVSVLNDILTKLKS